MPHHTPATDKNSSDGFFDRSRIIAKAGFNRWLVPPAALAIHLCIGMAYGFSVFWLPLSKLLTVARGAPVAACSVGAKSFAEKSLGTLHALAATDCEWTQFDLGWIFTLFFVFLGCAAAVFGGWAVRVGPRRAGCVAAVCWAGGLLIGALGVYEHQLWLLWVGPGVVGGIGLGLGYILPVSTLMQWFPDRRGMATGMAIMGFGGGAVIGSPLAAIMMNGGYLLEWKGAFSFLAVSGFKTSTSTGVWQTFVALAVIYFFYMLWGALSYRVPPEGWQPEGWTAPVKKHGFISHANVHFKNAHKTPQFWLVWAVLCLNVSAGIGIIGAASPMIQETFGGRLFGDPSVSFNQFTDAQKITAAAIGSGFVGLFSLFNIAGRFFWSAGSDKIGRKMTNFLFFALGFVCYDVAPHLAEGGHLVVFTAALCLIASMYGGCFATIPAYLADLFGAKYVGAIHGRLLTAWSTAGIVGPLLVNYYHDVRVSEGVVYAHVYDFIFYALGALLVAGLISNFLITPVAAKWHIKAEASDTAENNTKTDLSFGIGLGSLFARPALMAWGFVALPLVWGVMRALQNAFKILP